MARKIDFAKPKKPGKKKGKKKRDRATEFNFGANVVGKKRGGKGGGS